jgi:adenine-specific DNA-methyltransferase
MIKYIGSKRKLIAELVSVVSALPEVRSVLDLFSGTARVGSALRSQGYRVTANDHNAYAYALAQCYVAAEGSRWNGPAGEYIARLNALPGAAGYFTRTFCEEARYFQPKNGARIDAIREALALERLPPPLEAILLVSLMEAADRVDSTVGLQMAYLKSWARRAYNDLELRLPELVEGPPGSATMLDAFACARSGQHDLVYIDPPYNQHKYLNNYHVWESLVRWDKPEVYGVARKRIDCRSYDSPFNSRRRIHAALQELIDGVDARYLLVSFNDEGYVSEQEMLEILRRRGPVAVRRVDFQRYVGAKIGIYSPAGVKTGTVGRLRNQELMFVVSCQGELPAALGGGPRPGLARAGAPALPAPERS